MLSHFSCVWLFAVLWTVAHQAPLSMGFSRQEYWSELWGPPPGDIPHPGIKPKFLASQADSSLLSHWGSPLHTTHMGKLQKGWLSNKILFDAKCRHARIMNTSLTPNINILFNLGPVCLKVSYNKNSILRLESTEVSLYLVLLSYKQQVFKFTWNPDSGFSK